MSVKMKNRKILYFFAGAAIDVDNRRICRVMFAADIAGWLTGGVYVMAVRCRRKMEDQKMKDRGVKFCRNCTWGASGWRAWFQERAGDVGVLKQ